MKARNSLCLISTWLLASSALAYGPTPATWGNYSKFPDPNKGTYETRKYSVSTELDLELFRKYLANIADAEAGLRNDCAGAAVSKMTAVVKGTRVLVWPTRYQECEGYARLVASGDVHYQSLLTKLNKMFGAAYSLPTGDASIVWEWESAKAGFLRFPGCDDASRKIVFAGEPGLSASAQEVFDANKGRCPAGWVALFQADDTSTKENKKLCGNATAASGGLKSDGTQCSEAAESQLEADLRALQGDEAGRLQAQGSGPGAGTGRGASPSGNLRRGAQGLVTLGASGKAASPIYGGQTGELLEAGVQAAVNAGIPTYQNGNERGSRTGSGLQNPSGAGCDPSTETAIGNDYASETNSSAMRGTSIERQQCLMARASVKMYQRLLPYAQRCKPDMVGGVQSNLADSQRQANVLCGG
ncbi:hypothetical protein AWB78_08460 [Caballeronia calidae]|uniref:Uncharacterized protein n=1 Tax=Caballeronia calidae TaxID=1777139 RepID=A0A158EJU7_9BURK|nr:hypothetical protein [Caballeronia calidae]SAL07181.1 hypothetical protein AWB78_08460 [Caballeronia calidae]